MDALEGLVTEREYGDDFDVLFIGHYCVAEWAAETFADREVTVRYWSSAAELPEDDLKRLAVETILGQVDARYDAQYSEVTGYLWTDADFNVGGHDMLARLKSELGRYVLLEVEF
jgi:hypothetical protein